MNKKQMVVATSVSFVLVLQLLVLNSWWPSSLLAPKNSAAAEENLGPEARNPDVTAQQRRVADFIKQTGDYPDLQALMEGLSDPVKTDFDIVHAAGMRSSDPVPQMQFAEALADRRVARLYSMFDEMPKKKAADTALSLFDTKLEALRSCWVKVIARVESQDQSKEPIPISYEYRAASHALFLCGAFASPERVCAAVDDWEAQVGPLIDRIMSEKRLKLLGTQAQSHGRPQPLFLVNLYVMVLERNDCLDIVSFEKVIPRPFPGFRTVGLMSWDNKKHLTDVNFARSWGGSISSSDFRQEEIVAQIREHVESCKKD